MVAHGAEAPSPLLHDDEGLDLVDIQHTRTLQGAITAIGGSAAAPFGSRKIGELPFIVNCRQDRPNHPNHCIVREYQLLEKRNKKVK